MESDRATRAGKFRAYAQDPRGESRRAIDALADDSTYSVAFDRFVRDMVYGERATLAECVLVLRDIAAVLDDSDRADASPPRN
jgi:hypothetical protein